MSAPRTGQATAPAAPPAADGPDALDPLDGATLYRQFADGTLEQRHLDHRQHVRAAWLFLDRHPPATAMQLFPAALRRLAAAYGKPGLYHETITWAYLLLINERRARQPGAGWREFAAANADLLGWRPSVLDGYYRPATLAAELARRVFVLPDRAPADAVRGDAATPAASAP